MPGIMKGKKQKNRMRIMPGMVLRKSTVYEPADR